MAEPEAEWRQRVLGALGAVVAVGLVIGAVLGVVAYSTARIAGLAGDDSEAPAETAADHGARQTASQDSPRTSPTAESSPTGAGHGETAKEQAKDGHRAERRGQHADKRHDRSGRERARADRRAKPTLAASPRQVRQMGRIHLTGRYPGRGGTRLVVQRFERRHWARFPVSATVRGGRFRTWVASGDRGENRFRVVDPRARRASAAVSVRVH